jgi:hypothetical protein
MTGIGFMGKALLLAVGVSARGSDSGRTIENEALHE